MVVEQIFDLNQINDSHRARVQELESANKEFRRHMAVCEASDSAPSSSGVSSIPTDAMLKQTCDILQEYQPYNVSSSVSSAKCDCLVFCLICRIY